MDILDLVEERKIQRIFRARDKISFPGAVCHITQRAVGKEPLFLEESDYLYMLYLLKKGAKEFNFDVFCHCLMPNHIHLLIRLSKDNLSNAMKHLYERYAIFFNKKYQRKGHVFGGAFRQALCFDDNYLLSASLYVHLNPVKAKLIQNPSKYRWSSCGLYCDSFTKKTFVNYKFILKILDSNTTKARELYKQLLYDSRTTETEEVWENPRALELFRLKIMKLLPKSITVNNAQEDLLGEQDLEEKIEELRSKGRLRSPENVEARKFSIKQLRARGYSMEIIAKRLNVSRQTIYRTLTA